MPKGGRRPGSGRPKGAGKGHRVVVENPDGLMPIEWMLAVMRDPLTEPLRRDRMAEIAAPYLHSRLAAVSVSGEVKGSTTNTTNNTVNIFAVPRGASLNLKDGTVEVEGASTTELQALEPFSGTPALEDQSNANQGTQPPAGPLPVHGVDTSNVTRLKRPNEPGAMVQRVFDALDKRDTRSDNTSDNGAA
jgi:phage terminase small subunit